MSRELVVTEDYKPRKSPIAGKYIIWKDGMPCPAYAPPVTVQSVNKLLVTSLQLEYEPLKNTNGEILPDEEKHVGKSKLEVGMERAADRVSHGDQDTLEWAMDRVLGKPKQQVESLTISATYEDFLKMCKPPTAEELAEADITITELEIEDTEPESSNPTNNRYAELDGI
jgi:hypothetical protein